jgi:dihydrofolate reductase
MELIVAVDSKNGMALDGEIPWKIKSEMMHFKQTTINNIVIMGSKTYFSIPPRFRPLDQRLNIVLTRHPELYKGHDIPNVWFTKITNIHEVISANKEWFRNKYPCLLNDFKFFVIGGKQIYDLFKDFYTTLWITKIKNDYHCDLFFDMDDYSLDEDYIEHHVISHDQYDVYKYEKN